MGRELSLEEGIQEVLRLADGIEKPVIVGIYGMSNSGKTHFSTMLTKALRESGKTTNNGKVYDPRRDNYDPDADYTLLESSDLWVYREETREEYGKPVDITVLVKNERLMKQAEIELANEYEYDVRVNNPGSKRKSPIGSGNF